VTAHVKESENGDLSDFERRKIVGARLAGASVIKTATLLGVLRSTVSKVMLAYTNHEKTTSAKRNGGQKSALTERDRSTLRRIVLKNRTTTAVQVTVGLNIRIETPCPQKLSNVSFTNPTSTVGLQLLNLELLKVILKCVNDGVTHKTWTSENWKSTSDMVR
jgi:hypothetical protein